MIRYMLKACISLWLIRASLECFPATGAEGHVIEWGWDALRAIPVSARLIASNVVAVSEGESQALALTSGGRVFYWRGLLFEQRPGPSAVQPDESVRLVAPGGVVLSNVVAISADRNFGLALRSDGRPVCWGENYIPEFATNMAAIAATRGAAWGLTRQGTVLGWMTDPGKRHFGPIRATDHLSNVVAIAVGSSAHGWRGLALLQDGTVGTWGAETMYHDARPPTGLSNVVAIAAGNSFSLALKANGMLTGWGFNKVGQATGIPTADEPWIDVGPVRLQSEPLTNVTAISANEGYALALKKDGSLVAWGRMVNNLYPVSVPAGLSNVVAISAGWNYCAAITTNPAVAARFAPVRPKGD